MWPALRALVRVASGPRSTQGKTMPSCQTPSRAQMAHCQDAIYKATDYTPTAFDYLAAASIFIALGLLLGFAISKIGPN